MFTALALVVFSGVSMANTVEEKKVEKSNIELKDEVRKDGGFFECYGYAVEAAALEPSSAPNPHTGGMEGFWDNVLYYYSACIESEGTILLPVIVG